MCGIVGTLVHDPSSGVASQRHVADALELMQHRGPDSRGSEQVTDGLAWGMCRLAIRDLTQAGEQPFWTGDTGVVFNGEVYNVDELRLLLGRRGHAFASECDTEVFAKVFGEFGAAGFGLIDGMFAAAIIQRDSQTLTLVRDEYGIKPLYVAEYEEGIAFASELRAIIPLLSTKRQSNVNIDALVQYLQYQYIPDPQSILEGIRKIRRGTYEEYDLRTLTLRSKGSFRQRRPIMQRRSPVRTDDANGWVEATEEALAESVRRQLVSDRPLGVFLSGGIDSTLVTAFASQHVPGITAFGVVVPDALENEQCYIHQAVRALDVDLHEIAITSADFSRLVDEVLETYDEPFADYSSVPTLAVSQAASKILRVVLTGDGGDEMFGGYARYRYAAPLARLSSLPMPLLRLGRLASRGVRLGPSWLIAEAIEQRAAGGEPYLALLSIRERREAFGLMQTSVLAAPDCKDEDLPVRTSWRGAFTSRSDAIKRAMLLDCDWYLPADINTKVDRATMSVSLEARFPLLGAPMARLASDMPIEIKVRDRTAKWPLKQLLLRRGFSESFVHRKKSGFSIPIDSWLRNHLERREDHRRLFESPPPPLDAAGTRRCLQQFMNGSSSGHRTWSVLVLADWLARRGA